jgi:adenosylhomocysteine nucleosidase
LIHNGWQRVPALVGVFLLVSRLSFADTAIVVALPSEQSALSREVRVVGQSVELAQHRVSIGYHKGEKVYIVRTGAGNLNSAMVTQALVTRYKIDRVISIGVAGNLNDDWKIGDLLIVTNVVNHQEGTEKPSGFEAKENSESRIQKSGEYEKKCEALRSNAVEVAGALAGSAPAAGTNNATETLRQAQGDNVGEGPKAESRKPMAAIHQGRLVSGDSFIASTAKRKWLRETFHADAVDMVSAGVARVCEANGVPYVVIRVLSDNADESASAAFTRFVQSGKAKDPVTAPIAIRLVEQIAPPHP